MTALVLGLIWGLLGLYFDPALLRLDTMNAGGDTPSFLRPIHHLRDTLLPLGNPQGFDLGNFAGYAPYQFYFLPPALGIVALSTWIPFNVAFKLMTVAGTFLLPLTTALTLRALGQPFPLPAIGAAASLLFLFNEGNSMWGGNIQSTLAGEFAFSLSFSLAVLFLGLLYRGIETQRGWRSLGALLAFIGLCHPVAFLNAATPGLFFLLGRRDFVRNLRFIVAAYGTAVLLMGFWLIPLVAKLTFATSINWIHEFQSFGELLPPILWPAAAFAGLDALWVLVRRKPEDRAARYLVFSAVATAFCFLNATEVGLPEIRFVPFTYMILLLLAVDFLGRVLPLRPERWEGAFPLRLAPHAFALAFALVCAGYVSTTTTAIPSWIRWNYEGVEKKPSYPLLQALARELAGSIDQPRVFYENSPKHDRFGSMRIFENMALLTGRGTLEGVLLQTATTSPYIYWLQSQVSKLGTGVIPGYPYPDFDPQRAAPRLALFNVSDLVAVTDELKAALDAEPRWEKRFQQDAYAIYRLRDADPHYVRAARAEPVLLDTRDWKREIHNWWASERALDVPLVAARTVPEGERALFPNVRASGEDLPRVPLEGECTIEERIDHHAIEFTTSCPGRPHWISVSYYPNWHAEGARGPFLAGPGLMLVVPEGPRVRLAFERLRVDQLGLGMSALGLVVLLAGLRGRRWGEPEGLLARALDKAHPWLLWGLVGAIVGFTVWHQARTFASGRLWERGHAAFHRDDYAEAERLLGRVRSVGPRTPRAADSAFFHAASLLRMDRFEPAMAGYEQVIVEHPASIWIAESHYHVALCLRRLGRPDEATARFEKLIERHPANVWSERAREQLAELAAERAAAGGASDG